MITISSDLFGKYGIRLAHWSNLILLYLMIIYRQDLFWSYGGYTCELCFGLEVQIRYKINVTNGNNLSKNSTGHEITRFLIFYLVLYGILFIVSFFYYPYCCQIILDFFTVNFEYSVPVVHSTSHLLALHMLQLLKQKSFWIK